MLDNYLKVKMTLGLSNTFFVVKLCIYSIHIGIRHPENNGGVLP